MKIKNVFTDTNLHFNNGSYIFQTFLTILTFIPFFLFTFIIYFFKEKNVSNIPNILYNLLYIISIIYTIIIFAINYGFTYSLMRNYRNEKVKSFDFITITLKNFNKIWNILLRLFVKIGLPTILFSLIFIFTIINILMNNSSFSTDPLTELLSNILPICFILYMYILIERLISYSLVNFLLFDNLDMSAKELLTTSKMLVKGYKFKYFLLFLLFILIIGIINSIVVSTIPNKIISFIIRIILFYFITIYMITLKMSFYENIIDKKE